MAELEELSKAAILDIIGPVFLEGADANDVAAAYEAVSADHYCSLARQSEAVFADDTLEANITIDTRPFKCWDMVSGPNPVTKLGFRGSADQSIQYWREQQDAAIELRLQEALSKNYETAEDSEKAAFALGDAVPNGEEEVQSHAHRQLRHQLHQTQDRKWLQECAHPARARV
jgi:hypothetical protein